jgi:hypothetical protein
MIGFARVSAMTGAWSGGLLAPVLGQMAMVRCPEARRGVGLSWAVVHQCSGIGKRKLGFDEENLEIEHVEGPIYRTFGSMSCATRSRTLLYL